MLLNSLFYQISDSNKTLKCVQKAFFTFYISHTFKALLTYGPFVFDAVETNYGMGTTEILAFSPPHPMVCMHFRAFTPRVHIMLALFKGNYGEMAAVLTQNGIAKGSVNADTDGMTLLSQGSWFWLLQREVNFKLSLHGKDKARCSAPLRMGRHLFRGIGLLSWFLIAYATIFVKYQIKDEKMKHNDFY